MCIGLSSEPSSIGMKQERKRGEISQMRFSCSVFSCKVGFLLSVGFLIVLIILHTHRVLHMLSASVEITNHSPGRCRSIPPIECGAEDISVTSDGLAFISSGLRTFAACDPEKMSGKVYLYDFKNPYSDVIDLTIIGNFDYKSFIPHGLGLYEDKQTEEVLIYIVNHANPNEDTVEVFSYVRGNRSLVFQKTIKHDFLKNLNDVVLVGKDNFYATNDRYFHHPIGYLPELLLLRTWGSVVHFHSGKAAIVADSLLMPNGINIAPDKKYLYIMETLRNRVVAFRLNGGDEVGSKKMIPIETCGDNIEVDRSSGDLYIGSSANFYKLLLKKNKGPSRSLTQVTKVRLNGNEIDTANLTVSHVYSNDGSEISGGSVAAHYNGHLLIGSVFHKLLHCQLSDKKETIQHSTTYSLIR